MSYQIDFKKFVVHMLPTMLRSNVLIKIIQILIIPIIYIFDKFNALKNDTDKTLNTTANVQYLQKALNDAFFFHDDDIYIDTTQDENKRIFFFESEGQAAQTIYLKSESSPYYLWLKGESTLKYNFTVHIPSFLCTSVNPAEDEYNGVYYRKIVSILNKFKPAGRTYSIEIYDYD
jgi:hypothetical protein